MYSHYVCTIAIPSDVTMPVDDNDNGKQLHVYS